MQGVGNNFTISISSERLITKIGTIIPQAINFPNGNIVVFYHVGNDAYFTKSGAHISKDNGRTWAKITCPLHRVSAIGVLGTKEAIIFDQYLWKAGENNYLVYASRTYDSGLTFTKPELMHFHPGLNIICTNYQANKRDHPDYYQKPEIPKFYHDVVNAYGAILGGYVFGRVIKLSDCSFRVSAYCDFRESRKLMNHALCFKSTNQTDWKAISHIGTPNKLPFDWGKLYSEGFNETAICVNKNGVLYALMRHGSYMMLYQSTSRDGGHTWTDTKMFNYPGVAPSVCRLRNGPMVAAWGRPGLSVGFSLDGQGQHWDAIAGILNEDEHSWKYPWIVPISNNSVLLFYDRATWSQKRKRIVNHGIYCREVAIK